MSSRMSAASSRTAGASEDGRAEPEISSLAFYPDKTCNCFASAVKGCRSLGVDQATGDPSFTAAAKATSHLNHKLFSSYNSQTKEGSIPIGSFAPRPKMLDSPGILQETPGCKDSPDEAQEFDNAQYLRWCLAAEVLRKYPAVKQRFAKFKHGNTDGRSIEFLREIAPEELLEEQCSNWSTAGLLPGDHGLVMGMVLWFASMAFGGIHAAAWYDYFPSYVEATLWRSSAIYITW